MIWGVVRGFFYLWFSLAAGLACAYAIVFALGPSSALPAGGWPLVITPPALILASLVLGQLDHFGQRITLRKWIPFCLAATIAVAAIAELGL